MDTLTLQENGVRIEPVEEDWEREEGKGFLYPENSFVCNVVLDADYGVKGADIVIRYSDELLTLDYSFAQEYGVTMDTSTPGEIHLSLTQSTSKGEHTLGSLYFTAKKDTTGCAYVAVAPESTVKNASGTFLFSSSFQSIWSVMPSGILPVG